MTANLLPVIVAVHIFFGVSEGLTLTECTSGCLYAEDRTTNIVTCEGFHVNEIVVWEVFYQKFVRYSGTCNGTSCSPNQEGFNATVLPAGNASVLTIDLRGVPSLNYNMVRCSSGGKTVSCTLQYTACPSATAVDTTPPHTTSSTEFVQNISMCACTSTTPPTAPTDTTSTSYYTDSSFIFTTAAKANKGDINMTVAIAGGIVGVVVVVLVVVLLVVIVAYIAYRRRKTAACDHPQPRVNQEYSPYTELSVSRDATGQHTQHDYVNMATPEHNITSSNADNLATDGAMQNTYESLQIGQGNDANTYDSLQITSR